MRSGNSDPPARRAPPQPSGPPAAGGRSCPNGADPIGYCDSAGCISSTACENGVLLSPRDLQELLEAVRDGRLTPRQAQERLKDLPYEDLGFANLDHHRALRRGFPEVVFGAGKSPEQVRRIVGRLAAKSQNVLVTRATHETYRAVALDFPEARFHPEARCVTLTRVRPAPLAGRVAVVCAGTSDVPVAEEAAVTAEFHGARVDRIFDVGVAGLHRLLDRGAVLRRAHVLIVAAGMEGALPSVVGGLVEAPVIALPTSVGYGSSFKGLAALLSMLNSCASGLGVVNIDNGFGAGYLACSILRISGRLGPRRVKKPPKP